MGNKKKVAIQKKKKILTKGPRFVSCSIIIGNPQKGVGGIGLTFEIA